MPQRLTLSLLLLLAATAGHATPFERAWPDPPKIAPGLFKDALALDFNADDRAEIVITDIEQNLLVLDGATGAELWREKHQSQLSAPIAGNFLGNRRFQILILEASGKAWLYDGLSGRPLAQAQLTSPFASAPSLLAPPPASEMAEHDAFVFVNQDNNLKYCQFDAKTKVLRIFQTVRIPGDVSGPPVVADIDGQPGQEVLVSALQEKIHLCRIDRGAPFLTYQTPPTRTLAQPPVAADLDGGSAAQLIVCLDDGKVHVLDILSDKIEPLYTIANLDSPAIAQPLVFALESGGKRAVLLLTKNNATVFSGDRALTDPNRILDRTQLREAAIAPFRHAPGELEFLAFEAKGRVLHLHFTQGKFHEVNVEPVAALWAKTPLAAPFLGPEATAIFAVDTRANQAQLFQPRPVSAGAAQEWLGRHGGFSRGGQLVSLETTRRTQARRALSLEIAERLSAARDAAQAGDWDQVCDKAELALTYDPLNTEARELLGRARLKRHLPQILIGGGVLAVLLLIGGYFGGRAASRHRLIRRGQAAETGGDLTAAATIYHRVWRRYPKDLEMLTRCGRLYYQTAQFNATTAPVFERNLAVTPAQNHFLLAVAHCRMQAGDSSDKTLEILHRAAACAEYPAPFELYLGQCLLQQDNQPEARRQIELAIQHGDNTLETCRLLADLCIELQHRGNAALAQYDRLWDERRADPQYLQAYSETLLALRRFEPPAPKVCQQTLELAPDAPAALRLQANLALRAGDLGLAESCAARILDGDPNSKHGLWVSCHCTISRRYDNDETLELCLTTLEVFPDDPAINRHAARLLRQRNAWDDRAVQIMRHALELNPGDPELITAAANIDLRQNNSERAIALLEELVNSGSSNQENLMLLARAYRAVDCLEPRAEKAYWVAHHEKPEAHDYLQALAQVLMSRDALDDRALAVYLNLRAAAPAHCPDNPQLLRQLARALHANRRFDQAAEIARELLQRGKPDDELRQLYAEASLRSNQLDTAIDELRALLQRNPADERAQVNLAIALVEKAPGEDETLQRCRHALQISPDEPILLRAMARRHAAQGEQPQAVEYFQRTLRADADSAPAVVTDLQSLLTDAPQTLGLRWYLVSVQIDLNHLTDALEELTLISEQDSAQNPRVIKALNLILDRDPDNSLVLWRRGCLHFDAGQYTFARQDFEAARRIAPSNPEIAADVCRLYERLLERTEDVEMRYRLGEVRYHMQDYDRAIAAFQAVVKDYRWENQATLMLGKCFYGKGMLDLALQEFRKLPIADETKALLYDLGRTYEKHGDLMGAKTAFRQVFASDINYRDVREKFERLAGSSSAGNVFEKTSSLEGLSEEAQRRYELIEEVGRGAMGIVYRAHDRELEETVALKILPENLAKNPDALARFKSEARSARRLAHANIVRIHDIGEESGRKYISMEFVEGTDLKQLLRVPEKLSRARIVNFAIQIAEALDYAHSMGIIHRDIKPANIMIADDDVVKVSDFGIAKVLQDSRDQTTEGLILGTPLYMSPEQILSLPPDTRSDLYSLGVLLYECLSGRPPFTEGDLSQQHLSAPPPPIQALPPELTAILQKSLEKDAADRYQTGAEFATALKIFLA